MSGSELQQTETQTQDFAKFKAEAEAKEAAEKPQAATKKPEGKEHKKGFGAWAKKTFIRQPGGNVPNPDGYSWEPPHPRYK